MAKGVHGKFCATMLPKICLIGISSILKITSFPGNIVSFDSIKQLLASDMSAVDEVIRSRLHSEVVLVNQVGEYIINGGGKRLRPALVVLSAGAFGYDGSYHHVLAAVVEFIHTATLLHDDVVDESELRRGRATASAMFGNAASVLVGDFLYSRAFQMMVEVDSMRVMQTLADATNVIAEGEVLQLLNCHDADVDAENYLHVIHCKTAKLFEAAMRLGAILGGADSALERAAATYGMHLGTAFQLVDDVLDYSGDEHETGKNLGDDLAEGKPTLPLIYAMQHGNEKQSAIVRQAIENGDITKFSEVLGIIRETGALEYTRQEAQRESALACAALSILPNTKHKESLLQLADFAATREF
jgi:octaprenyl-diphosphate synthase